MKTYNIITVENDEDEQFFMREGFNASGLFRILAQPKNGDEMLEWLHEQKSGLPDLILTDLNMPGKNGYDIIVEIKGDPAYAHIPVVVTSTSSTQTIIDRCLSLGASDYVVKPDTFVEYASYAKKLHRLIEDKALVQ